MSTWHPVLSAEWLDERRRDRDVATAQVQRAARARSRPYPVPGVVASLSDQGKKGTTMFTRLVVCALVLTLSVVLAGTVAADAPTGARAVSTTERQDDAIVQACDRFDLVASYTAFRDYRFVTDPSGALVHEERFVRFSGSVANGETGRSLSYDGEFTRIADYDAGSVSTHGFVLWDGVLGEESTLVTIDQRLGDLTDDLPGMLLAAAPQHLGGDLCGILDDQSNDLDASSPELPDCQIGRAHV